MAKTFAIGSFKAHCQGGCLQLLSVASVLEYALKLMELAIA